MLEIVDPKPTLQLFSDPVANRRLHRFFVALFAIAWPLLHPFKLWAILRSPREARERMLRRADAIAQRALSERQYQGFAYGIEAARRADEAANRCISCKGPSCDGAGGGRT